MPTLVTGGNEVAGGFFQQCFDRLLRRSGVASVWRLSFQWSGLGNCVAEVC